MSDAEWENDDFEPPPVVTVPLMNDRWEGEDEDDVKENWEDEDEDDEVKDKEEKETESVKATQPKKKKTINQILAEKEEKKLKKLEEKVKKEEESKKQLSPEEIYAEKLKQREMQEKADLELAKDAFGEKEISQGVIDSMLPSTKEEFDEFRKALVTKISQVEKSTHYILFLDDLFRELTVNLEADDVKKLTSTLNAMANEKVKAQKVGKHKKKAKKASVNVGKGLDDLGYADYADEYEDFI
ncbi:eukaryotic translation initiation factor 3 subunit J-like isoform X1 [Limulus polyphemus]|uniref:Eukaryotic translation initiation factor 3 subunit J n=1 Tax=Limulus polyphemus TaxID=6850 RepID=A0ABM1BKM9_LIMPO|nr:eukaryotic translation initiation factor 3 subunit J-like isoform X1 [Limulus polyphemus]